MVAQKQDTALTLDCKVECRENHYFAVGTFQIQISTTFDIHELDQIEAEIEQAGQEFKRQVTRHTLEAADRRIAEVAQVANPDFHKHGTRPFTIVARYGDVNFDRQRLHNPKKKKENTLIPSAIAWNTSHHRHLTAGLIDAACKESQQVAYRKASQNLADTSGQESLIAASTVWNKKQQRGKELKSQQKQCVDKIMKQYEPLLVEHKIVTPMTAPSSEDIASRNLTSEQEDEVDELFESFTQYKYKSETQPQHETQLQHALSEHVAMPSQETEVALVPENTASEQLIVSEKRSEESNDVLLVQLDEVVTKSQEKGRKTNLTYTGTVENRSGKAVYLVAESSEALIRLVAVQLVLFGLFSGKRLEVLGDGARWIALWALGIQGIDVVAILCWYHLCKRVYEGLSGLGLAKEERKRLEREILGHLWRGEHCLAIWKLWGLRSSARNGSSTRSEKRLDDLIGYLLRKKHQLANYEERHARGEWIASTRVEKWNDVAVSQRCKHRGMSWTESGVLAVATYAENIKQKSHAKQIIHTSS